jgi:hypothetical protein
MNNLIMFISVMSGGLLSTTKIKFWQFLILLLIIKFLWICFK